MKPTEKDIAILRAFSIGGALTTNELAAQIKAERDQMKTACERLYSFSYLNREWVGVGKQSIYTLASKGRNLLKKLEPKTVGEMPAQRSAPSREPYSPKPIVTRPGSQDFLKCPSRRGDSLVAHALPLSLAGRGA
jgi:hypothetical protein